MERLEFSPNSRNFRCYFDKLVERQILTTEINDSMPGQSAESINSVILISIKIFNELMLAFTDSNNITIHSTINLNNNNERNSVWYN